MKHVKQYRNSLSLTFLILLFIGCTPQPSAPLQKQNTALRSGGTIAGSELDGTNRIGETTTTTTTDTRSDSTQSGTITNDPTPQTDQGLICDGTSEPDVQTFNYLQASQPKVQLSESHSLGPVAPTKWRRYLQQTQGWRGPRLSTTASNFRQELLAGATRIDYFYPTDIETQRRKKAELHQSLVLKYFGR